MKNLKERFIQAFRIDFQRGEPSRKKKNIDVKQN